MKINMGGVIFTTFEVDIFNDVMAINLQHALNLASSRNIPIVNILKSLL